MIHDFGETRNFSDDMTFGETLRKARRINGISQTDLAEMVGLNQSTISYYETGTSSPPLDYAVYILEKLGFKLKFSTEEFESED